MIQTFTIPDRLPSLNEMIRADRGNKFAANRLKRHTQERIGWCIRQARLKAMTTPVTVSVVWVEQTRRRDLDNITAATKYVLDALVECGIIPDDGQRHVCDIRHRIAIDPDHPRVVVTLEEVGR